MKLIKGDEVIVTIGKDKGKQGKIEQVLTQSAAVIVAGVNISKRHQKRQNDQKPSGIVEIAKPLAVGKVALICPKCKKPTRVGYILSKNEKHRICKKCKQMIS